MLTNILKMLLAINCLGMFFYSVSVFGFSAGLLLLPVFSALIVLSVFYKSLSLAVTNLCKGVGILSLIAFLLLMLAGTIGGSFHLSPSNQVIAALLVGMALFGLSSLFWSVKSHART